MRHNYTVIYQLKLYIFRHLDKVSMGYETHFDNDIIINLETFYVQLYVINIYSKTTKYILIYENLSFGIVYLPTECKFAR